MPFLTQKQLERLVQIIKDHVGWLHWRVLGERYVSEEDLKRLRSLGILPMDISLESVRHAHVLGRLESVLKRAEWKKLTFDELEKYTQRSLNETEELQLTVAEWKTSGQLMNFSSDVESGIFDHLSRATGKVIDEAAVKDIIRDKVKLGVEVRKTYAELGDELQELFKDNSRRWRRVASTEMHYARQRGMAAAIESKVEVYKHSKGISSKVAIQPASNACKDCIDLYTDSSGNPKIFTLSDLYANSGSNYVKPWRKNAKPVLPPLHPHCFCVLRYIPEGWGFNDKGRLVLKDKEAYEKTFEDVEKSSSVDLNKADLTKPHDLLSGSSDAIHVPEASEILRIPTVVEAYDMADRLGNLAELHFDDYDAHYHLMDLKYLAMYRGYVLENGGFKWEQKNDSAQ